MDRDGAEKGRSRLSSSASSRDCVTLKILGAFHLDTDV